MFVLMNNARRPGIPEQIRSVALSVNQVERSVKVIKQGQKDGSIKKGDPLMLSTVFWSSLQGVMEAHAANPGSALPNPDWLLDILRV